MDSGPMDTSEDGISTAEGGRPLRDTKARQDQQAKLKEQSEQLEEFKKVEEGDISPAQKKKSWNEAVSRFQCYGGGIKPWNRHPQPSSQPLVRQSRLRVAVVDPIN
ncbi:hypothetical protein N7535_005185 [Penicillium sp. DV-2018c]|nr:hypothetical protein N7461_008764 [Penicillium sp. DV-2018c]KAJ5571525.1 hypothetical protein N7535_005185 [Penicillium sp. DV-2018c]